MGHIFTWHRKKPSKIFFFYDLLLAEGTLWHTLANRYEYIGKTYKETASSFPRPPLYSAAPPVFRGRLRGRGHLLTGHQPEVRGFVSQS